MNNLAQVGKQLSAIWAKLGLNQRISIVIGALAIVAGLASLLFWSSRPELSLLYGKLDDTESAKVINHLDEAKIPYRISRSGGAIYNLDDKVHKTRMQLAMKGIPGGEGPGWELFDKPNFGISDFVQRANFLRAVQGELARTISQLDGVSGARVMITLPENRLLVDKQKKPTASIWVKLRGLGDLSPATVNAIRFLVANSVEGLAPNNVSVVDNHGTLLTESRENDPVAGQSNNLLTAKRNAEKYLAEKVETMLALVLGSGQSVARVSADINWDTITRTEEKFDPEGQVIRNSTINDEKTESTTPGAGGTAGVVPNTTPETNSVAGLTGSKTAKKTATTTYDVNKITSQIVQGAGTLKRISAAVFVNTRMTGTGTNRVAQPRTPEELKKFRLVVQSALGIDTNRTDEVTLEEVVFNDQPVIELNEKIEKQEKYQFVWSLLKNFGSPALALVFFALFLHTLRKTKTDDIPIGFPLDENLAFPNGNGGTNANGNGHGNGHANGNGNGNGNGEAHEEKPAPHEDVVTAETLNRLIRENPANMTHAIRAWLVGNSDQPKPSGDSPQK
ncbi:hypothetical protein LBMAG56_29590 [Verrucomicrobiota bacterium]|nr:hypothetical protein LBMAG56_29590 [Verrucomicrobiota bacterium]